jgi:hypothetical protein
VLRRVLDGFAKCALVAAHYAMSDVLDNLVISLTKFTTLLHHSSSAAPLHTPDTFRIAYGANAKALLATRAVFSLTHKASVVGYLLFTHIVVRTVDPDPAFQVNPNPIRIHGFDEQKKLEKKILKNFFFLSKFAIYLCPRYSHQKRTSSTSKN